MAVVDDLGATLYIGHKRLRYDDVRFFGRFVRAIKRKKNNREIHIYCTKNGKRLLKREEICGLSGDSKDAESVYIHTKDGVYLIGSTGEVLMYAEKEKQPGWI